MATMLELLKEEQKKNEVLQKKYDSIKKRFEKKKTPPPPPKEIIKEVEVVKEVRVPVEVKVPDPNLQARYYETCDKNIELNRKYEDLKKRHAQLKLDKGVYVKRAADFEKALNEANAELEEVKKKKQQPILVIRDLVPTKIGEWKDSLSELSRLREEASMLYDIIHRYEASESEEVQGLKLEIEELKLENDDLKHTFELCDGIVNEYQTENESLKAEVQTLKDEVMELRIEKQKLQGKVMSRDISITSIQDRKLIIYGKEKDLYPGEQRDIILEYLKEAMKSADIYTRKYAVLKSVIEANPENGTRSKMKEKLKEIFKDFTGCSRISAQKARELKELGFELEFKDHHASLFLKKDNRYRVSVACTPSDNRSLNTVSDIARVIL